MNYNLYMNKINTTYKTISEMESLLKKRGLIIDINIFHKVNYAHLIYKFSTVFYVYEKKYKEGTRLSDIYNLYIFNQKFSQFLYKYVSDFEHLLKREIASQIAFDHGYIYLKKEFYGDVEKLKYYKKDEFQKFLENLRETHNKTLIKYPFLKKKTQDGIIPIWIFIDELTIGQLRMFLKFWKDSAKVYKNLKIDWIKLKTFNVFRNAVFHMNPIKNTIRIKHENNKNIDYYLRKFLKTILINESDWVELIEFWNYNKYLINKELTGSKYHNIINVLIEKNLNSYFDQINKYQSPVFDTIAAISSGGSINQPISIIRLSGPESFKIISKHFTGKLGKTREITLGSFVKGKEVIDPEVMVAWFKNPNSFTGEDLIEIYAHGGVVITNEILRILLASGARQAQAGEFSRRAFLNGKLDLVKADAIHDLIFAKTGEQARLASYKFDGSTSKLIDNLKDEILNIIATIETNIDYPEYDDIEVLSKETLLPKMKQVKEKLNDIIQSSKMSKHIFDGVSVAIVGRPNVGKSSLLNAFLGKDKAIVTDVAGTTRDIVEGSLQVGQVLLNFKDTAGIRSTKDKIETIGVKKSLEQIKDADLVIHVIDSSIGEDKDDKEIQNLAKVKPYIKVFNKSDIRKRKGINISTKNNDIKELIDKIKSIFKDIDINDEKIIGNNRQLSLIEKANNSIDEAIKNLKDTSLPEEVIIDIRAAWEALGSIIGRADQEDLLDSMFSNFCIGK